MILSPKQLTIISVFIIGISSGFAQNWFSHEVGIVAGPVFFQSDFGERGDFDASYGNVGFGIGVIHFMNFDYRRSGFVEHSYFNDHFRVRSEVSWNRTKLKHYGKWVAPDKTDTNTDKLRAHTGMSNNINLGMQLEYFPLSIRAFSYEINSFAPYISLGIHYTLFVPSAYTSYGDGDINNLENFYEPWYLYPDGRVRDTGFITTAAGGTFSIVGSIGTRYKLSRLSDLVLDLRWQQYFSDKVDGLNHKLPSNKAKDHILWLNFGYILYLD